jgi:hypothetical protein
MRTSLFSSCRASEFLARTTGDLAGRAKHRRAARIRDIRGPGDTVAGTILDVGFDRTHAVLDICRLALRETLEW